MNSVGACGNGGRAVCDVAQGPCEIGGVAVCRDGAIVVDVGGTPTCRGESLKDWRSRISVRWDFTDRTGARVREGTYAIWAELNSDRARFIDPAFRGGAGAARVEYCATGACP